MPLSGGRNEAKGRSYHPEQGRETERKKDSTAREAILDAVRRARLPAVPLPSITGVRDADTGDLVSRFMASVKAAAAAVQIVERGGVEAAVRERFPGGLPSIATMVSGVGLRPD